ncbi:lactonase family protein [Halobellus ruber]|uniref:Lactonase family protein n=1 Tax=Halobellus ruber TaxID=2761102 RepID=A0A7J9SNQ2_9EURY|nr:lactonase family protein [Halobellus ruber]MBB6647777.1 lactonase family protein [Halobellus ruber]
MGGSEFAVVGSYTREGGDGISTYRIEDKSITLCDIAWEENPSFLDIHPTQEFFVAVNERENGSAVSYRIEEEDGSLDRIDVTETGDAGPCHIAVSPCGEYAVVSHYAGGSVTLLSTSIDGVFDGPLDRQEHMGSGARDGRQTAPHPHSAWFVTDSLIYVPDLGTDQVVVYELDRSAEQLRPLSNATIDCSPGVGPRHLAIHPDEPVGYLLNELSPALTILDLSEPRSPVVGDTHSTLPEDADPAGTIAADVHVHPDGKDVFATNRGHNSITRFALGESPLNVSRAGVRSTGGEWPRNFSIHPDGEQIFICNQHSDNVVPFRFDPDVGALDRIETGEVEVSSPTCIRFL